MDVREFIKKWKLSGVLIAEQIGMPQGTFNNKFRTNQTVYKFSPEEEDKIKKFLLLISEEILLEFGFTKEVKRGIKESVDIITYKSEQNEREPGKDS